MNEYPTFHFDDDSQLPNYLPFWLARYYCQNFVANYTDTDVLIATNKFSPFSYLYRIVDDKKNPLDLDITKKYIDLCIDLTRQYTFIPSLALRKLAETKAFRMGNPRWEIIVRWKTKKILRKLEARFLPEKIYLKNRTLVKSAIGTPELPTLLSRRFGIYYRVSTESQETDSQKYEVEKYIDFLPPDKKPNYIKVYEDKGISGADDNRPSFQQLLSDVRHGIIDTVVVYRLDRFTRSSISALRLILEFEELGVDFIAVDQPILAIKDMPFKKTILSIFSELAQIERETIVSRVKAGLNAAKARGVKLGRPIKYTEEEKNRVLALKSEGKKAQEIADLTGYKLSWVKYIINKDKKQKEETNDR